MKIVLASHSTMAEGVLDAARMIAGANEDCAAFGLTPDMDGDALAAEVCAWLDENPDPQVLILSDLYFGSPFNAMCMMMRDRDIHHVTGMNLAMVLEALSLRDSGLSAKEVAEQVIPLAHEGIVDANELLES